MPSPPTRQRAAVRADERCRGRRDRRRRRRRRRDGVTADEPPRLPSRRRWRRGRADAEADRPTRPAAGPARSSATVPRPPPARLAGGPYRPASTGRRAHSPSEGRTAALGPSTDLDRVDRQVDRVHRLGAGRPTDPGHNATTFDLRRVTGPRWMASDRVLASLRRRPFMGETRTGVRRDGPIRQVHGPRAQGADACAGRGAAVQPQLHRHRAPAARASSARARASRRASSRT